MERKKIELFNISESSEEKDCLKESMEKHSDIMEILPFNLQKA